jgi:LPS-assembly lipoprotein
MSSFERAGRAARPAGRAILFAVAAAFSLAACTVQPLYGPTPSGGTVPEALTRITIEPVDTRVAQEVRNKLIFDLTGGARITDPIYRMRLTVTSSEIPLGVTPVESAPAYSVTVTTTYALIRVGTDEIVLRSTARGTASYDRVNQVYANVRAKLDAEIRAAALVAVDIRLRVASAIARGVL